jgi:hypothetical protein
MLSFKDVANFSSIFYRSHLKNRILVQDSVFAWRLRRDRRGGAEFQTAGIRLYVEDLKRDTNPAEKGGRPKDIFEMASSCFTHRISQPVDRSGQIFYRQRANRQTGQPATG